MPATGSERRSSAVTGGMDTSRRLSASSDGSLPERDRQFLQENVETIPTRLPKLTSSKPAANPLQFIKVGPCDLYRSAQEQIRKVEEVKKIKQKRDEAEDWQSNLDNWKNCRRKRQEHIIERVVEVKKFELEEFDRNRRRSKTFNEMMEERTNRGRKVSLVVYKDDDDKDLSDLGIGGNSASKSNGCDSNENLDMVGNDDENLQRGARSDDSNGTHDSSVNSQEPQEFTYEQAIQGYVNFAETRVKAKSNSRNEQQLSKEGNLTPKSEERLNDVGRKKEKTPPPVAPKPRKYSLKLEDKVPNTERKNSFLDGNDHVSENSRKLSLPQVDVFKRREVFEKSLASKEQVPKNKPTELLESKSVKERLSCLGISVSATSGKNKSVESPVKTVRQPNLPDSPKQVEGCTNITSNKVEENCNIDRQNSHKTDAECLKEYKNEQTFATVVSPERPVDSVQEQSSKSETCAVASDKNVENCSKQERNVNGGFHENADISDDDKLVECSGQNWQNTGSRKADETSSLVHGFSSDRWKLHRSLDSLDRKYCEDMSTKLLERVQSLDVLEQFNSVRDYPLSSSSAEMLGSSNGGDTDREDSGIHTADVSCSISQTDEAVEYGDPSTDMSHTFSHLMTENNICSSEVPEDKYIMEEHEFSSFQPSSTTTTIEAAAASRELTENFILSERQATVESGMKSNVSFHSQDVENADNTVVSTTVHTSVSKVDGFSSNSELESNISSKNINSNTNISHPENMEFLSDEGCKDSNSNSCTTSSTLEKCEVISHDTKVDDVSDTVFENQAETVDEEKIHTKFAPDNDENIKPEQHENSNTNESNDLPDVCCIAEEAQVDKPVFKPVNETPTHTVEAVASDTETSFTHCAEVTNASICTLTEGTPEDTQKENICHETSGSINECSTTIICESSDRNSAHTCNTSITDNDALVVAVSGVSSVKEDEMVQKEHGDYDPQENDKSDIVDLDSGDGKPSTLQTLCVETKDPITDHKESKEAVKTHGPDNTEEIIPVSKENHKYVQHSTKVEEEANSVVLNERTGVSSRDGVCVSNCSDYSVQKQSNVADDAENSLFSTAMITKDFRKLRIPESPTAVSDDLTTSMVEVKESQKTDHSQIKCEILPLNLSSEVEIVAGLTFPLGPVTLAEPPKEKPPPPPPSDISDDEQIQKDSGLKRMDSTKRIKKEMRRKRTNFLGIEGNADDSYLEPELRVAPPPDMTTFLMEEQRLQKQLYRQSICSESDSNLGETTDSRDSGVEMEKGNSDDIWVPKPLSTPEDLSVNHSRQNSDIYANTSIASEDDEIAKKEREIIEILEKEEQWRNGHSPHNHEEDIGEELSEKLWQLEQENLRHAWEKESKRRELEETVQRHEEEIRQMEREREIKQQEALLQIEQRRLERGIEVHTRHKDPVPIPQRQQQQQQQQQWANKGRLSLQDVSAIRHPVPRNSTQFPSRTMLPEHCQSLPDLLQKPQDPNWKQHSPVKSVPPYHNEHVQQDWRENESYNRNNWAPAFSPVNQQNDHPASGGNHIQGQPMTRLTFQALSAVPRSRLIPTENWIQAKRKPESKRGTFNSQHWIIQEAEQRRITEQQQRNAMASQKMPTSQLSQPLNWMHQQPQQKKPLPDAVISTLTQRVQNKVENKKYINRPRIQDCQSHEEVVGHHNVLNVTRPNGNPGPVSNDHTEKMLSVSGKKKCSHCGEELGRGAAMIIESLRLFYHIDCFKCCVCHIQLGDGLMGTDVRVRNNKLHCHNCYSSEDGVKFSCV